MESYYLFAKKFRNEYYEYIIVGIIYLVIVLALGITSFFIHDMFYIFLVTIVPIPISFLVIYFVLGFPVKKAYFKQVKIENNIIEVVYKGKTIFTMDLLKARKSFVKVRIGREREDFLVIHNDSPLVRHDMKFIWKSKDVLFINNKELIELLMKQ